MEVTHGMATPIQGHSRDDDEVFQPDNNKKALSLTGCC